MYNRISILAALAAAVTAPAALAGTVLFDSGVSLTDIDVVVASDAAPILDNGDVILYGNSFSLGSDNTIGALTFTGAYLFGNSPTASSDDFSAEIYSIVGGSVGALQQTLSVISVSRTDTGQDYMASGALFDLYDYQMDVTDVGLLAGDYFLSVFNDTSLDADDNWAWGGQRDGFGAAASGDGGTTWANQPLRLDFQVLGAEDTAVVPLPAGLPLMLGGLAAFGLLARRRKA